MLHLRYSLFTVFPVLSCSNHLLMKRILLTLLLPFFWPAAICSFAQPAVNVSGGKVTVAGVEVNSYWNLKPVLDKLGSDYRLLDGYNRVYTFDAYGLTLFEKKIDEAASNELTEIQLYFAPAETKTCPLNMYNGQGSVEKLRLASNLTSAGVLRKLKKYKNTESYTEHNYRLASKGIYIYFQFNDAENKLLKVSIGPDRR